MSDNDTKLISGYSMPPTIWQSSILQVTAFDPKSALIGDVVLLALSAKPVARRISGIDDSNELRLFELKEDASDEMQKAKAEDITYTVLGIANQSFSFKSNSTVGKMASRIALSQRPTIKVAKKGLNLATRLATRLKTKSPF